jgi:hypothetical protein
MKLKINLLYYKNILDRCFTRFFEEFNDSFVSSETDGFVYTDNLSDSRLKKVFERYISDELSKYITKFDVTKPEYYFIIGSCVPGENILFKTFSNSGYFPEKYKKLINIIPDVRYFLFEQDIRIDMRKFCGIVDTIFCEAMQRKIKYGNNVYFIRHNNLDCYMMFKIFKQKYRTMIVNLHKKHMMGEDRCIYSVNEIIDKYCDRKLEVLNGSDIQPIKEEIYQYITACLGI